jgi:alkylation response protein AidB-like acyl-CoA dehydrogenase
MRNMPGVALGVARAALDYAREVIADRRGWSESWRMQVGLAECEADFFAARAGVYAALRRQWEVLSADTDAAGGGVGVGGDAPGLTSHERAALPLSRLHAFRTARSIVTRLYDLLQTASIYRSSPLDRWLRDTTTMCQHIVAQDRILQTAGAHLLGARPEFPLSLGLTS